MKAETDKNLIVRPPIVVVMGHIDHGKTKLLDAIRKTNVVEKESGGITQHIGAYEIKVASSNPEYNGRRITFIDTPGHEAFSKMRARGAQVGDVAILVVAADEGVKAQTLEALKNIQEAKIPFIVAINKIDKPEANPDRIKQQLAEAGVYVEGYGGNVPIALISAKEGKNIEGLLELILLVADLEGLKADPNVAASGVVIEAKMDSRKGAVVVLIIKNGSLKVGDEIVTPTTHGKIKILENFKREPIKEAVFSSPVRVLGFKELPQVGEEFFTGDVELVAMADKAANLIKNIQKEFRNGEKTLNLIVKADVSGSLEALESLIKKCQVEDWKFQLVDVSVGDITANDIQNAQTMNAWILGFRIKAPKDLEVLARANNINIFLFDVIYDMEKFLKEEVKKLVAAQSAPAEGECLVLVTFSQRKSQQLVGGKITKGKLTKGQQVKIWRGEAELGSGKILNIQMQKKDVREATEGKETGLMIDSGTEIKVGDRISAF